MLLFVDFLFSDLRGNFYGKAGNFALHLVHRFAALELNIAAGLFTHGRRFALGAGKHCVRTGLRIFDGTLGNGLSLRAGGEQMPLVLGLGGLGVLLGGVSVGIDGV